MREIRKDPVHNRWVIIASHRAKRPHAFYREDEKEEGKKDCPFCEGRENMTPPEIDSFRNSGNPDEPGWAIRVVPNKYPALIDNIDPYCNTEGLFHECASYGKHEVIIETPDHYKEISTMEVDEISLMLKMYIRRYRKIGEDGNIKYVLIFKNQGRLAGASLPHPHTQVTGLPFIPPDIKTEINKLRSSDECIYCQLIEKAEEQNRILTGNTHFNVLAPYVSTTPYELMIYPVRHKSRFEEMTGREIESLAEIMSFTFKKCEKVLGEFPYNFYIHTSPPHQPVDEYHWHIRILPKLSITAGFEKGSGIYINAIDPEMAIRDLNGENQ